MLLPTRRIVDTTWFDHHSNDVAHSEPCPTYREKGAAADDEDDNVTEKTADETLPCVLGKLYTASGSHF